MENHFATYNQSLALKELGFDEPCLKTMLDFDITYESNVKMPLKSQVFEWFREKHILSTHIDDFTANDGQVRYDFSIRELGSQDDNPNGVYEEYSDAESACIDALIKRVKQRL